jgi:hypothetical protein
MQLRCAVGAGLAVIAGVAMLGVVGGCQTTCKSCGDGTKMGSARVAGSASPKTIAMMDKIKTLAGEWEMENPEKPGGWNVAAVFAVSSGGNVVREIMFPGAPHEMTNTYHLDGDSIVVTHYCAIGNQPRMRAVANDGHAHASNEIHFQFDSLTNFAGGDQTYMGDLLLVMDGPDKMNQVWHHYQHGKMQDNTHANFSLRRRK